MTELIEASQLLPVTVIGKPACQQCVATTRKLDKLGVPYTYRDATKDAEAADLVRSLGYTGLPVVTVGDIHWTGFRDARITRPAQIHSGTAETGFACLYCGFDDVEAMTARLIRWESLARHLMRSRHEWMDLAQRMQRFGRNMQRIAANNASVHEEAARWAAWFAAERDESRRDAGAAHGSAMAFRARVTELQSQVAARDTRIAELEAAQGEPVGFAVTIGDETTGRFVQAGAVMSRAEADVRGQFYADQGARVVELREVSGE